MNKMPASKQKQEDIYINTRKASEILGVDIRTVQEWCQLEKIPGAVKICRKWLINKWQMLHWLQKEQKRVNPVWRIPQYQKI